MKKYLSCIILILLCVVCAMIFYSQAREFNQEGDSNGTEDSTYTGENGGNDPDTDKKLIIDQKGTIRSEYITDTNLRTEWTVYKYEGETVIYLSTETYLDTPTQNASMISGYVSLNGEKTYYSVQAPSTSCVFLASKSINIRSGGDDVITVEVHADLPVTNPFVANKLDSKGYISVSEEFRSLDKKELNFQHIMQNPELPSGDEITSLAAVLSYLKYKVDKCDLCDLYLDKGPIGYTDNKKANIGNPREAYNSYGCLPPVIINSANKFINANGGNQSAYDMTGFIPAELYRQVSQGVPVIVWVTNNFDTAPNVSRKWIVDDKDIYIKSNQACMVLIGYDFEKNTVTLCDPASTVFTIDKDLFELRFAQMGSYAVIIK